jgi:tryptophan-rich sensory protein
VADLAVVALALLGPWRRHRLGPPLAVLALTFVTLVADVLTGSHLELNGLLGYDAIVAGRFTGYGNLTFGLLSVSALTVTAAAATWLARRAGQGRARTVTAATVIGVGLLTVAVVGAPGLGRDFGGVLAALPGFLLLAMLLTGVRVTVLRLAAVLAAAVLAVTAVAVLDWRRTAEERTHLGRFVEQVLTGEAWTVVSRKAQANLDILLGSPLAWVLPVAAVAAYWLLRPGGLLRTGSGPGTGPAGLPPADVDVLRAALLAGLLSLAVGAAVNDSGVALPATAAVLLVPLLVWLAARTPGGGARTRETDRRSGAPDPAEGAGRVTVVSRGSTVGNA